MATDTRTLTVALVGNPNAGKTTLFNALSGLRQRVGNYPGVTVEMKKGRFAADGVEVELIDLPGTYSLAARSLDEQVAVDLLLGRLPQEPRPDVVVSVVDASNLDRHLYLVSQLMELGPPVVLAVNMTDIAEARGVAVDYAALQQRLGVRVVPIRADRKRGLAELRAAVFAAAADPPPEYPMPQFPEAFDAEAASAAPDLAKPLARRLLIDVGGYGESQLAPVEVEKLTAARDRLKEAGHPVPAVEARARYGWVRERLQGVVTRSTPRRSARQWLDRVLVHRVWGTLVFLGLMFLVFQSVFTWAGPIMDYVDTAKDWAVGQIESVMNPGPFRSLLTEGVLEGVGGVLIFLPQIMILFGFIAVLEDCGYMARAAFLMDRVMSRCGLSGKSFIPMLSSVACAVPGVMAARVIEDRRDRLATILVAPLMSCSARLPVYVLVIAAFFSGPDDPAWLPGVMLFAMYMIGFVAAPLVALCLKRTLLRGEAPVFVMEMPSFRWPTPAGVLRRMADAGWAFVRRAGTLILASMVVIWALLYFPNTAPDGETYGAKIEAAGADAEANRLHAEWKAQSLLGRAGKALEPAFRPLGWDWKLGMAALASFPAREVVVGTLGIVYGQGDIDAEAAGDPESEEGRAMLGTVRRSWGEYGVLTGLSLMVFFALCSQCVSTLAAIKRETGTWSWPIFTFVYMTVLAYLAALAVFQIGLLVTG